MKNLIKTLSVFVMSIMLIASFTVSASTEIEDYNKAMSSNFTNGTMKMSLTANLKEPISKELDPDGTINSAVSKAKFDYDLKINSADANSPIFKASGNMKISSFLPDMPAIDMDIWIDMDLSNKDNLKYLFICKYNNDIPDADDMNGKYLVFDYTKLPGGSDMLETFNTQGLFDISKTQDMQKKLCEGINIEPTIKDGVYTTVINDADTKTFISNMINTLGEMFNSAEGSKKALDIFENLKDIRILDEKEGINVAVTLDDNKLLESCKYTINLDTDIAKFYTAFDQEITPPLTSKNGTIKGSLIMDSQYKSETEPVQIAFPEVTKENSIDMAEMTSNPFGVDKNEITVLYDQTPIQFEDTPVIENEVVLLPLRKILNTLDVADESITYDDGMITAVVGENTIKMTIGSNVAYVNDKEVALESSAALINDRTFVPAQFIIDSSNKVGNTQFFSGEDDAVTGALVMIITK